MSQERYQVASVAQDTTPELVEYARNNPISPGRETLVGRVALDGATVHIPDVTLDAEYRWSDGRWAGLLRTMLGVPLLRDGAVIGVIAVHRRLSQPFSQREIDLITTFADQAVIAIENVRLFEEVQARTRELQESLDYQTATSNVLKAISRSVFELQPVLDTLVETAVTLCRADEGFLFQLAAGQFRVRAAFGFSKHGLDWMREHPIAPERTETLVGRTAQERRPVHIEDVTSDPRYGWAQAVAEVKFRTGLGIPLVRGGEVVGVFSLIRTRVEPFSESQIELVQTFADQAMIAIENARLFNEVQSRTAELAKSVGELRALGEVTQAVNSTLDLKTVLDTIVAKAVELSGTGAGAIYVYSKSSQRFRLRSTYGMSDELIAALTREHVGPGSSYIGAATQERRPVQVPDMLEEPPSTIQQIVLSAGYRALLVLPLLRPGRVVGALVVRRKEPGEFSPGVIELLQTFATQSVIAIQNARLFEDVEARTRELAKSLEELRAAQERLIQTEKLASLGQLTAGIAHEIKNPLNFVNNFAALSIELIDELKDAIRAAPPGEEQATELMELLAGNLGKVVQHGQRADSIVKNMLLHSREGGGERRAIDLNASAEEALNLVYHSARAENPNFHVSLGSDLDSQVGSVQVYPQEFQRVLLNVISNGFYAVRKRQTDSADPSFGPELRLSTRAFPDRIEIRVRDNGVGIPDKVKAKIFNPFFTTKPAGEGTGLGLSLSHDVIVKQHGGRIEALSVPGEFTEFLIMLPLRPADKAIAEGVNDHNTK